MKFNNDFLYNYLIKAPIALALERSLECEILSKQSYGRPILDVGCGDGAFARILFNEKVDVGIDLSKSELIRAKKQNVYNELILANGNYIPKESSYFDTIYCNSVLEHIQDIESVIKEMYRVLKPKGRLYVTLPTDKFDKYTLGNTVFSIFPSLQKSYRRLYNKIWKHYHYYPKEEWVALFAKHGFEVSTVSEYGTRNQCLFNDFLVFFSLPSYIIKKIFNRYFLFPYYRKILTPLLGKLLSGKAKVYNNLTNGGLIFFSLEKA